MFDISVSFAKKMSFGSRFELFCAILSCSITDLTETIRLLARL
jgi:hypothetical protein